MPSWSLFPWPSEQCVDLGPVVAWVSRVGGQFSHSSYWLRVIVFDTLTWTQSMWSPNFEFRAPDDWNFLDHRSYRVDRYAGRKMERMTGYLKSFSAWSRVESEKGQKHEKSRREGSRQWRQASLPLALVLLWSSLLLTQEAWPSGGLWGQPTMVLSCQRFS